MLELYLASHPGPRKVLVIDLGGTGDSTHGHQQLSFFHGCYQEPGENGFSLAAVLPLGKTQLPLEACRS
jgi:hypothetical protein